MAKEFNPKKIRMIVGLGNPGIEYEETFHNTGGRFIKFLLSLSEGDDFSLHSSKTFYHAKSGNMVLVRPNGFMNDSGDCVLKSARFFKIKGESLFLAHDDSDLLIGSFKIQFGRGAAGHKGVLSVQNALGTNSFWRIRIGIRKKEEKKRAGSFVLSKIQKKDSEILSSAFIKISETLSANRIS